VELKEIRSLVALSELGSISLVAQRLYLSPPAIHKQLKTLEGELDVQLYEKSGKQLQLTQAASILLPHMKELLIQHDSAISALKEWKGMKHGDVRIGTGPNAYIVPVILKHFRQQYPGIEVLIETGNTPVLMEELGKGSLDLTLIVSGELSERHDFQIEAVWDFELVLVSHQKNLATRPHLNDLKNQRFISFRAGSRMQAALDRYMAMHQFEPKVVMRLDNADFIRSMVRSGMGTAFLPLWVVERDIKEGHLHLIHPVEDYPSSKIALIRRKSGFVPHPVKGFIEAARSLEFKHLPLLSTTNPATPAKFKIRK